MKAETSTETKEKRPSTLNQSFFHKKAQMQEFLGHWSNDGALAMQPLETPLGWQAFTKSEKFTSAKFFYKSFDPKDSMHDVKNFK